MRPLRVLHVIESLGPGGAEALLLTSLRHLDRERCASEVVALWAPLDLALDIEALGIPVHCLGLTGRAQWWRAIPRLIALCWRLRPDIVHTHLRCGNLYGRLAAAAGGVPAIVSTLHNLDYSFWPPRTWKGKLVRAVDAISARRFGTRFIAVSAAVREDYHAWLGIDLDRVEVIYNYVENLGPTAARATRAEVRAEFGWTPKDFVLLTIGRLAPEKAQTHIIAAMPAILAAIPGARLLIVGGGPEEPQLRAQIRQLGLEDVVTLPGQRRDVPRLLGAADVFVFPSLVEGFGMAAVEAMAAEVPVIVSRARALAEVVDDEVTGLVVSTEAPDVFTAAVLRLHGDASLRRRLAKQARAAVLARFTAETGLRRLEAFYEGLRVHRAVLAR